MTNSRWKPEIERYWFCRGEGHVIVSDTSDEMVACPAKDGYGDSCGRELFGPVVLLADVTDWDDEPTIAPDDDPDEAWLDLHFDWRNCTCGTGCLACEYGAP